MTEGNLTGPLVQSIGWALVHFVWQGALIAAAAAAVLALLRAARPTTRYAIACAALIVMCAAPVVTTLQLSLDADGPGSGLATSSGAPAVTPARSVGGGASAAAGTSFVPTPSTLRYPRVRGACAAHGGPPLVCRRAGAVGAPRHRMALRPAPAHAVHRSAPGAAAGTRRGLREPAPHRAARTRAEIGDCGGADPRRVAPSGHPVARGRGRRDARRASRSDYRARARARAAPRLPDQRCFRPSSRRCSSITRRYGGVRARCGLSASTAATILLSRRAGSRRLRHGARESRGTAARRAQVRAGGNRRAIAGPRAPRAGRAARARWPLSHLVGQRCDCRRARAHRRAHHGGGRESERWYHPEWRRGSSGHRCARPVERSCRVLAGIPALTAAVSRDFSLPRTAVGTGTAGRPGVARTSCRARASSSSGRARAAGRPGTSDCSRCSGARRVARTSCTSRAC